MHRATSPERPILVVDDEAMALRVCERALKAHHISNIKLCDNGRDALHIIDTEDIEVMLLDLTMPGTSGREVLNQVSVRHPQLPVIIITGANDVRSAVECIQGGAFDYMVKPVEEARLASGVRRAMELRELQRQNQLLRARVLSEDLEHPEVFGGIVTRNKAMHALFKYTEAVAGSPKPVLICGETGVGKELVAHAIHRLSGRPGPFVAVNAAGLDDAMFADTLFGHIRGAFTGAERARPGMIEKAADGTLFLDEVGDLASPSQVKLLRLLQEQEYLPLGADMPRRCNTRFIMASNQDIPYLVRQGAFRKDLYFRLQTHSLHIPPLRDRIEDLPLLVEHFAIKAAQALGKEAPPVSEQTVRHLERYVFPGNVRELEAMVFDAVSRHTVGPLPLVDDGAGESAALDEQGLPVTDKTPTGGAVAPSFEGWEVLPTLEDAGKLLVREAMRRAKDNQGQAARMLGISRPSLNKRLKRYREA